MLIDLLIPLFIAYGNNLFAKVKIDPEEIKLKSSQKGEVKAILDKVFASIDFSMHPGLALLIVLPGVYAMNVMYVKMAKELELKEKETKKQKPII